MLALKTGEFEDLESTRAKTECAEYDRSTSTLDPPFLSLLDRGAAVEPRWPCVEVSSFVSNFRCRSANARLISSLGRVDLSQLLFLRLFSAQISLSFFLAPLPTEHQSKGCIAFITRRLKKNWVGARDWAEVKVEDEGVVFDDRQ